MRAYVALSLCAVVAGCGAVAKLDSGINYRQSQAAYRDCMRAAPNVQACERERLVMEADERAYTNVAAGVDGNSVSANVRNR